MSIRCLLGFHDEQHDILQRWVDMISLGVHPTPSWRCERCHTHRIWLPGVGWSIVPYGDDDNLNPVSPASPPAHSGYIQGQ